MKLRYSLGIPVAAALAVVGLLALRADPPPAAVAGKAAAPAPASPAARDSTGSRVTAMPSRPVPGPAVAAAPTPVRPSLYNDFLRARDYRAIYDRLRNSAEGETAEGRLVLWEIMKSCATITEGRRYSWRPQVPKREDFVAGIAAADPNREARIAAFDDFTANKCAGFEGVAITQSELDKLLASSAAAGDPRARALTIEQELWQARRTSGRDAVALSDTQIDTLKQLAATRDPEAIRVAGRVMSNVWADTSLRVGQQPVEQRPFMNAWLVLACEYGQPCGSDTPRMQQACALQGHCNAQTFPDYLFYYSSSPHESQLLGQYRAILRNAIDSGDWSQLLVVRGLPTPSSRINFVPGPR